MFVEIFKYGVIRELYYGECDFPIDKDSNSIVYMLNSVVDHTCQSKVIYHSVVLEKKRKDIDVVYE